MSRKDYQLIADAIASCVTWSPEGVLEDVHPTTIVRAIATRLVENNPRFDDVKFNRACFTKEKAK